MAGGLAGDHITFWAWLARLPLLSLGPLQVGETQPLPTKPPSSTRLRDALSLLGAQSDGMIVVVLARWRADERSSRCTSSCLTPTHSHLLPARRADQFDAVLHIEETRAVESLERTARWERGERDVPETYPHAV